MGRWIRLDMEKFELDLGTNRAIFPRMGIEQHINRTEGIIFRTAEGLLLSDLKEAPATTCQRNSGEPGPSDLL